MRVTAWLGHKQRSMARKVLVTLTIGLVAYYLVVHANAEDAPWPVVVGIFVGSVAYATQSLADVASHMNRLRSEQDKHANSVTAMIQDGLGLLSKLAVSQDSVDDRQLPDDPLAGLVSRASRMNDDVPALASALAGDEIRAVSRLLDELRRQHVVYEGEDRDWLLSLTRHASQSIWATSLTTVDAGGHGFVDGGLWLSDLGQRYVEAQRRAIDRGVQIQRVFVMDRPALLGDDTFIEIYRQQSECGIQVRILDPSIIPASLHNAPSDFILFDNKISYETIPAAQPDPSGRPIIVRTALVLDNHRVSQRIRYFNELWRAAR